MIEGLPFPAIIGTNRKAISYQGDYKLNSLQSIVEGNIELVETLDGYTLVINEEGKILGLEVNEMASELTGQIIVGTVLYCDRKKIK